MKMLKKSLFAVAMLAIVMPAFAGQLKVHEPWPCAPIPQEVAKIDVIMDVGYYINIVDQKAIKVVQDTQSANPYHDLRWLQEDRCEGQLQCSASALGRFC